MFDHNMFGKFFQTVVETHSVDVAIILKIIEKNIAILLVTRTASAREREI
jgi:hypothetical protein